jgi:hypothetical protein
MIGRPLMFLIIEIFGIGGSFIISGKNYNITYWIKINRLHFERGVHFNVIK